MLHHSRRAKPFAVALPATLLLTIYLRADNTWGCLYQPGGDVLTIAGTMGSPPTSVWSPELLGAALSAAERLVGELRSLQVPAPRLLSA